MHALHRDVMYAHAPLLYDSPTYGSTLSKMVLDHLPLLTIDDGCLRLMSCDTELNAGAQVEGAAEQG